MRTRFWRSAGLHELLHGCGAGRRIGYRGASARLWFVSREYFSRYVRDLGVISLERAVAQASAAAANAVFAYDRGRIAIGSAADVIVFDPIEVADRATFTDPHALSVGMKKVYVNGTLVLDDGKFTGARPGRVIRGPGYRARKGTVCRGHGQGGR